MAISHIPYWALGVIGMLTSSVAYFLHNTKTIATFIFGEVDTTSVIDTVLKEGGPFGIYAIFVLFLLKQLLDFCGKQIRAELQASSQITNQKIDTLSKQVDNAVEATEKQHEIIRQDIKNTREYFKRVVNK